MTHYSAALDTINVIPHLNTQIRKAKESSRLKGEGLPASHNTQKVFLAVHWEGGSQGFQARGGRGFG